MCVCLVLYPVRDATSTLSSRMGMVYITWGSRVVMRALLESHGGCVRKVREMQKVQRVETEAGGM